MTTITTKVRDWKPGESTEEGTFQDEWERAMIEVVEREALRCLKGKGYDPITITTRIDMRFTVLAGGQSALAAPPPDLFPASATKEHP